MPLPIAFKPSRGTVEALLRVREQARIQFEQREAKARRHEILPLAAGQGVYRLPEPSKGDVYFDIEGARFVGDQGFEYLLGIARWVDDGTLIYEKYLANTPNDERRIFDQFMQRMASILEAHPDMHIYHFHTYEQSALKRLSGRYALHQDLLDDLLRRESFVDLHQIVRHTLRAGVERYSIKDLEPYFGYQREVELRQAGDARHDLETWLEFNNPMAEAPADQVEIVVNYNRDDCLATQGLHAWMEQIRADLIGQGNEIPRPVVEVLVSEELGDQLQRIRDLAEKLRINLPELEDDFSAEHRAMWLLSHLLEFYRREEKAVWWEYFRLDGLADEDRLEEKDAIAGLVYVETISLSKTKIPIDRYTFPSQELAIKAGGSLHHARLRWGTVAQIDLVNGTLDVRKMKLTADLHPHSAYTHDIIRGEAMEKRLIDLAARVLAGADTGLLLPLLLTRALPVFSSGRTLKELVDASGDEGIDMARKVVNELSGSALGVQGPPGTGKTYTGAHMILAVIQAGKKVGVTGPSHPAIRNLLEETVKIAKDQGVIIDIIQKGNGEEEAHDMIRMGDNDSVPVALAGDADVAAGTAWLWARDEMAGVVDVLFIDEAGQFSLANTCAVSHAAKSLVLLGDPQQLDQPLQGTHPPGVDASGLQHILGDAVTMPPDRGLFLPETWRMHPTICDYISEMFYEGKLTSQADRVHQQLVHPDFPEGAGLWFMPVEHDGNQSSSVEEAEAVAALVKKLLAEGKWIDHQRQTHELTAADILIVTPYNAQLAEIRKRVSGVSAGTVDKFQGQEAPVVIVSYATSTPEEAPRGMDFLYSLNRLNVAVSRARCAVFLVCSPKLIQPECKKPRHMRLANGLARYIEKSSEVNG